MADVLFIIFALAALLGATGLLASRHPLAGALCLVGTMLGLSGLYALLAAPFLAVVQILTYAGAIMMLIIFVIMVLGGAIDRSLPHSGRSRLATGLGLAAGLFSVLALALSKTVIPAEALQPAREIPAIGLALFAPESGWWLLILSASLLLLAAMAAAILLAKRRLDAEPEEHAVVEEHA